MEGEAQMIDPDVNYARKIPDSPKDVIQRVMQARRMQDPRTALEFHEIFKPSVRLQNQKILKTQ
jgi:hypothetical protein